MGLDGESVSLLIRARSVPLLEGGLELAGVIADVTERRRNERSLEDLLDRYRLLVELSPDAIIVHQGGTIASPIRPPCVSPPPTTRSRWWGI